MNQALAYLFKSWFTAAVVFPIGYTFYYIYFLPNPDGMIWLWCMIAVPVAVVGSLPCCLAAYVCFLAIERYSKNIPVQKMMLCLSNLLIGGIVYLLYIWLANNSYYSISFVFCYWLVLSGCIWLYRLKPRTTN
jgi:hypothetical protein